MKIKLKKNLKYFEFDDSEFQIQVGEVKELPEKHIRSYSIKYFLFHGLFEVTEGSIVFKFKTGMIYVAKNTLYCKEGDKYFQKNLEYDEITFIKENQVPKDIMERLMGAPEKKQDGEKEEEKILV